MAGSDDRRKHPRLSSSARIAWTIVGRADEQIDRLRDVSGSGALVASASVARAGDELRFDLLDDDGERFASGLARVVWVDPSRGMGIAFSALGIDLALVASLAALPDEAASAAAEVATKAAEAAAAASAASATAHRKGPPPLRPRARAEERRSSARASDEPPPAIHPLEVRKPGVIIGIDLGTTNTCASYVQDGKPVIIPGRTGTNTIPSMITFDDDGTAHVGQRAADRQVLYPLRTVYGSKRLVGRTYRAELAAELQRHFAYPLAEAEGQRFGVRIDDRVVSMDEVAARVLEEVRTNAEEHLNAPVEAAVITVPAYFSEVQREAVRRAAADAKLVVHRIVNEPTAAAVAYGHKQAQKRARVAVWDFGGGTFDFSIVDVTNGQIEVVATGGDNFVGGSDFDDLLASHLLDEFQRAEGLDVDPEPQQIARLREAAEVAKRALSVQTEYVVELPEITREPKRHLRVEITRDRFEGLTRELVQRTVAIASEVMTASSLAPTDVEDVILVGGTTRIPAVQRAVAELFQRRPSKRINPDEAVALGAALLAEEIGSGIPTLLDILPMSVGHGSAGLRFSPIVARNTRLPTFREVTLDADLLGVVTMPIFQGESPDVSRNEYLCSATVEDASLWDKGRVTFRLSFDEHCVMSVDARNTRTGRSLPLQLDRARPVEDVLRDLGKFEGPRQEAAWQLPQSRLGRVLGKLFKLFGR